MSLKNILTAKRRLESTLKNIETAYETGKITSQKYWGAKRTNYAKYIAQLQEMNTTTSKAYAKTALNKVRKDRRFDYENKFMDRLVKFRKEFVFEGKAGEQGLTMASTTVSTLFENEIMDKELDFEKEKGLRGVNKFIKDIKKTDFTVTKEMTSKEAYRFLDVYFRNADNITDRMVKELANKIDSVDKLRAIINMAGNDIFRKEYASDSQDVFVNEDIMGQRYEELLNCFSHKNWERISNKYNN